jgi:23S rRNA (guanosine2251-2'-O)-methyltransferase
MRKLKNEELNRLSVEEFKLVKKIPVTVVLDNIRSMNNIGSVFRTADAFRIEKIYLCGITAKPPHPEIHKTALGATESVNWEYVESTVSAVKHLKGKGYSLIAIEQTEESVMPGDSIFSKTEKVAVVFGHEVRGVGQEVVNTCDYVMEIPQFGTKHSLNISVCAGIVLWELSKQFFEE